MEFDEQTVSPIFGKTSDFLAIYEASSDSDDSKICKVGFKLKEYPHRNYYHGIRLLNGKGDKIFESIAYKAIDSEWHYVKLPKQEVLVGLHGYLYGEHLCNLGLITSRIKKKVS